MPEETVMTIDYDKRYGDERLAQGDDNLVFAMRDDLCAAINELRSTIAAQHDTLEEQAALIAQQIELLDEGNFTQMEAMIRFQSARIAELEAQLAATLATIEVAAIAVDNKSCYFCEGAGCPYCSARAAYQE